MVTALYYHVLLLGWTASNNHGIIALHGSVHHGPFCVHQCSSLRQYNVTNDRNCKPLQWPLSFSYTNHSYVPTLFRHHVRLLFTKFDRNVIDGNQCYKTLQGLYLGKTWKNNFNICPIEDNLTPHGQPDAAGGIRGCHWGVIFFNHVQSRIFSTKIQKKRHKIGQTILLSL